MRYSELAETCQRIGAISKRLEARAVLADLIRALSPEEIAPTLYMLQGQVRPDYEGVELGAGEALAVKAIAQAWELPEEEVKRQAQASGDLGTTAGDLRPSSAVSEPLSVLDVYGELLRVARMSGTGSQEQKTSAIAQLLRRANPLEAQLLTRLVLGKLRLGVKEMSLIDAFAVIYGGEDFKGAKARIETAFNVTSDLGEVGVRLAKGGLPALEETAVTLGKPVRAMLAEREATLAKVLERMEGTAALEYKYDGLRLQAHVGPQGSPQLFSRRLENLTEQFPEICAALPSAFRRRPVIVDGECVPFDPDTGELRPFQEISRRRGRKYDLDKMMEDVPVKLVLFDILLDGAQPCLTMPYAQRRALLEELVIPGERIGLSNREVVQDVTQAETFFDRALADGCEGVVAKSVAEGSVYKPGGRGFWWIKYKREYTQELADTVDAVIVGAFHGRGKRAGWFGAFLMAVYDPVEETFPTLCKVGTGFDEASLQELTELLHQSEVAAKPEGVESSLEPDVWVEPSVVLELTGAELSLSPVHFAARNRLRKDCGLALRFPRFSGRRRTEKAAEDCTTVEEIVRLYETQVRKETPEQASDPPAP